MNKHFIRLLIQPGKERDYLPVISGQDALQVALLRTTRKAGE